METILVTTAMPYSCPSRGRGRPNRDRCASDARVHPTIADARASNARALRAIPGVCDPLAHSYVRVSPLPRGVRAPHAEFVAGIGPHLLPEGAATQR